MSSSRGASPEATPVGALFQTPKASAARTSAARTSAARSSGSYNIPGTQNASPARAEAQPSASAARPSTATAGRPPAAPSATRQTPRSGLASVARTAGRGAAAGPIGVPTPRPYPGFAATMDVSGAAPDVQKQLKEIVKRRDDAVFLRVLPKSQQLQQLILEEGGKREQAVLQEQFARMQIVHKAAEDKARKAEQEAVAALKARQETLKQQQQAELAALKESVAAATKDTDAEVKSKLPLVSLLHPRLGAAAKALADIKDESSSCAIYGELLEEEKKVQRALKGDARYNNTKTAEKDGGASPYWHKQCVAASFNVAAVLTGSPLRACVQDCPSIVTKVAVDKKVVVVKKGETVVAWAQTRCGPDAAALAEAFMTVPTTPTEVPASAGNRLLWTKDQLAEVVRKAKAADCVFADIGTSSKSILEVDGVESAEFTTKDIEKIGATASQ